MPCKIDVPIAKMTYPGQKTSLRRSQSLSQRPRIGQSLSNRSEDTAEVPRTRRLSIDETTQFYVLQPKAGVPKLSDGKMQYSRPLAVMRQDCTTRLLDEEMGKFTKHKPDAERVQLSPKSILKNFTAASYRNPVLVSRLDGDEEVSKPSSCLRSNDTKRQVSSRSNFRYRLSLTAPSSANEKKVSFDEEVSYINENNLHRRRHSSPSLPLL